MEKYFVKYNSIEEFEADKANLPANCVIMVGTDIGVKPASNKKYDFTWSNEIIFEPTPDEEAD